MSTIQYLLIFLISFAVVMITNNYYVLLMTLFTLFILY